MLRWNGWGDESVYMQIPPNGLKILENLIGKGRRIPAASLEKLIARIPDSRLSEHPLISTDRKLRLDHAHGQSLPDWIALRFGTLQHFPDGVAMPTTVEAVEELLKYAAENDVVIIPFGGGTSVVGHLNVPDIDRPVLSLSLECLNRLIELDSNNLLATFEAGIRGPEIEAQLNARGFTLGHYPQSFEFSSLGGWVATRSCGQQSGHYGRIEQLFAGGEILTPNGAMQLPTFPASAAGPDLRHLLLGSEGRMGILTRITVKISMLPEADNIYGVFFSSWSQAQDAVRAIAATDIQFSMTRLSNSLETKTNLALAGHDRQVGLLKRYLRLRGIAASEACMCLIGFTGSRQITTAAKRAAFSLIRQYKGISLGKALGNAWKKNRFRSAYLRNTLWDLGYAVDTLETAVNWDKVTPTMENIEKSLMNALKPWNEEVYVFTHLSHVYPTGSSIYTTFLFRLAQSSQETLARWNALKQSASQAIVDAGGTITHQHGVGKDHRQYLSTEKGDVGLKTLQVLFRHLDPGDLMNPEKLLQ